METAAPPPLSRAVADIRRDLLATVDPKAPDEKLLVELAAEGAALGFKLGVATDRLAEILPSILGDPKKAVLVARVLHDLVTVHNALARRVEGALMAAATLRVQRRVHRGHPDGL